MMPSFSLTLVALVLAGGMFVGCGPTPRGRVRIVDNVVVASNGALLRGENPRWNNDDRHDPAYWSRLRDEFHLNTVRILCYQPPQNWSWGGRRGPGWDYDAPTAEEMIPALDEWVAAARREGFYAIIDYHPVGGHGEPNALQWWSVIAPRYADQTHVLYEACNEPVAWHASQYTADDIAFELNVYLALRSMAPDTHIILWSFANGDANMVDVVAKAPQIDYANASVGWHIYAANQQGVVRLRERYPVIQTEIGSDDAAGYNKGVALCERMGICWFVLDGTSAHKAMDVTWEHDGK